MKHFKKLLNECIEHEASYFRDGSKKQEVIDYVEALERKIAELEAQINEPQEIAVDTPVLVELVEIESEDPIEKVSAEPVYEAEFCVQGFGEFKTSVLKRTFTAIDFLSAAHVAEKINNVEFGGRKVSKVIAIREIEE